MVLLMNKCLKAVLVLVPAVSMSACTWLLGEDSTFRDRSNDYRKARIEKPIELPEGVQSGVFDDRFAIPAISDRSVLTGEFETPRPDALTENVERDAVRINKLGDQQWVLVDGPPGHVWPRLRSFLNLNHLSVQRADAVNGILETTWFQPSGEGTLKERFRFRIDQGVQRGSSEVYILQADVRAGEDEWPETSSNTTREAIMIKEISQYLADNRTAGSVSMLAQQAIDSSGRVTLEQEKGAEPYIHLKLPFFRAWASLGRSIRKAGFQIDDLDRSRRVYFVHFGGDVIDEADEPGWFGRWFGDDEAKEEGMAYFIRVQERDSLQVTITVERQSGESMEEGEADKLLKLIKRHLS